MKVISLYSGAGGLDLGAKLAGYPVDIAIEMDKHCCATLKENFPDCEVIQGNVHNYISTLPKADLVFGGPPCPQFSRANPERTYDLCEVNNFWEIVERCKAKNHLMENVVDMKKYVHRRQILINCADYGIAQTRQRRFFTNLSVPIPTHFASPGMTKLLDGQPLRQWIAIKDVLKLTPNEKYVFDNKYTGKNMIKLTRSVNRPCFTITTAHNIRFVDREYYSKKKTGVRIPTGIGRLMTNEEAAILQGFPVSHKFIGGITATKKMIGNAVPPPVAEAFFKQISHLQK